jgi:RHS repeat-associated protein
MKKTVIYTIITLIISLFISCGNVNYLDETRNNSFPSPGAPSGNDAINSSTNRSGTSGDEASSPNGLSGAAYIKPPEINNYGSVNLSYQIDVPQGRMSPNIGLSYSSSGSDGLVGIGWNLATGLAVISRTTRYGELHYDYPDTFTFNGKRLIKVDGSKYNENGTYRLEIESGFARFELDDIKNGGVWKVYDKSGTVTVLGETKESRVYDPDENDKTYIWNFTRSTDLYGNYMEAEYSYNKINNISYLSKIKYSGNVEKGEEPTQYVKFEYIDRKESYISKAPGFRMVMDKKLDKIIVGWNDSTGFLNADEELWSYTMVYKTSIISKRPLLETVESTRNTTKPEFTYTQNNTSFYWNSRENPLYRNPEILDAYNYSPDAVKYFSGDFSGDGISETVLFLYTTGDFKAITPTYNKGYLIKDYGTTGLKNLTIGKDSKEDIIWLGGGMVGDFDGNSKSDIPFYVPSTETMYVALHNGERFNLSVYGGKPKTSIDIFSSEWFSGDFDANGLSDALLFEESSGTWVYMHNTGKNFNYYTFDNAFKNLFRSDYDPNDDRRFNSNNISADNSKYGEDRSQIHFLQGDFTASGRTDILIYDNRSHLFYIGENELSNDNGAVPFKFTWKKFKTSGYLPEDIIVDASSFARDLFTGDFNSDGYNDFLIFKRNETGLGDFYFADVGMDSITFKKVSNSLSNCGAEEITQWIRGDFNGDGRTDIGFFDAKTKSIYIGEATVDLSSDDVKYQLTFRRYINLGNLAGNNSPSKKLMKTPMPISGHEIIIERDRTVIAQKDKSVIADFQFNGNLNERYKEQVFPGNFTGRNDGAAEFLIYKNKKNSSTQGYTHFVSNEKAFYFQTGNGDISADPVLEDIDLDKAKVLFNGKTQGYKKNDGEELKDGLFYYTLDKGITEDTFTFYVIYKDGSSWQNKSIAEVSTGDIENFNPETFANTIGDFNETNGIDSQFLVYNNNNSFNLYSDADTFTSFEVSDSGDITSSELNQLSPGTYYIFPLNTTNGQKSADLLLTVRKESGQQWYRGRFDSTNNSIAFIQLSGDVDFYNTGYAYTAKYIPGRTKANFIYSSIVSGKPVFYALTINETSIQSYSYYTPRFNASFKGEYDHQGNPIIYTPEIIYAAKMNENPVVIDEVKDSNEFIFSQVNRNDLITDKYPFRWLQGDYNFDNRTDIGIFNILENKFYFALTTNGVGSTDTEIPQQDVISKVKNGIGGTYDFEYILSSSLENKGDDNIYDLSVSYLLCSKMTISGGDYGWDMRDNRTEYSTTYGYENGFALSAFIDGYKEVDFLGFGTFTVRNDKTVTKYTYNTLHEKHEKDVDDYINEPEKAHRNYRYSRALNGAVKNKLVKSRNGGTRYSLTEYDYKVHEIYQEYSGYNYRKSSFLVDPISVKESKYHNNDKKTITSTSKISTLVPGKYELDKIETTTIDHYTDTLLNNEPVVLVEEDIFEYDEDTNQTRIKDKISLKGSKYQKKTSYKYNDKGNLEETITQYDGHGLPNASPKIMKFEYTDYGLVYKTTDTSGIPERVTIKKYDEVLNQYLVESTAKGPIVDLITTFEIDYGKAFGSVIKETDPNNNSVYMEYDDYGRLYEVYADTDSGKKKITKYDYNGTGGKGDPLSAKVTQYYDDGKIGKEERNYMDGLGRVIHAVRSSGSSGYGKKYVKSGITIYDRGARVMRQSQTHWAGDSEIDTFIENSTEKKATKTSYDKFGRVLSITSPAAYRGEPVTQIQYIYKNQFETWQYHSIGRMKISRVNGRGQLLYSFEQGNGDDGKVSTECVGFLYNEEGNRIIKYAPSIIEEDDCGADGCSTLFTSISTPSYNELMADYNSQLKKRSPEPERSYWFYDGMGNLTVSLDVDLGWRASSYNDFNEVQSSTDGLGKTTYFYYDKLGRMDKKILPEAEGVVLYSYDTGTSNSKGKLVGIVDPSQAKTLHYDKLGRLSREDRIITGEAMHFQTDYEYDLMNRPVKITYPQSPENKDRMKVLYDYTSAGVYSIESVFGGVVKPIVSSVDYNEFGQMKEVVRGNNTATTYNYDYKGRLFNLVTTTKFNGHEKKIQDVVYTFKIDNSISKVVNSPTLGVNGSDGSSTEYNYIYDGLNRLVHATGQHESYGNMKIEDMQDEATRAFERGYKYASNGNIVNKTIYDPSSKSVEDKWTYNYNNENHAVTGISSTKYGGGRYVMEYDSVGNMLEQHDYVKNSHKQMSYDSRNRITQVVNLHTGEMIGEYSYDDDGLRVKKVAKKIIEDVEKQVEVLYPSMYFGIERQMDMNDQDIQGTHYSINNIYLNGVRIAAVSGSGKIRMHLTDNVDSVKLVTDDSGTVLTAIEYLPYGETWFQSGDEKNEPKYNSQILDDETGFYYYNARYYSAELGRFLTADSVIDGEDSLKGWNRYMYVGGNPIMYKDPTGHNTVILQATSGADFAGGATKDNVNIPAGHTGVLQEVRSEDLEILGFENKTIGWMYYSRNQKLADDGKLKAGSYNVHYQLFDSPEHFFEYQASLVEERNKMEKLISKLGSKEELHRELKVRYDYLENYTYFDKKTKKARARYNQGVQIDTNTKLGDEKTNDRILNDYFSRNQDMPYQLTGTNNIGTKTKAWGAMVLGIGGIYWYVGAKFFGGDSNNCKDLVRRGLERVGIESDDSFKPNNWYVDFKKKHKDRIVEEYNADDY